MCKGLLIISNAVQSCLNIGEVVIFIKSMFGLVGVDMAADTDTLSSADEATSACVSVPPQTSMEGSERTVQELVTFLAAPKHWIEKLQQTLHSFSSQLASNSVQVSLLSSTSFLDSKTNLLLGCLLM